MRYDAEHKAKTHEALLRHASRALRADGPDRVAVAAVMKAAGLTHGGFYAHFRSKDAMLAAAIKWTFEQTRDKRMRESEGDPVAALARYVEWYLSPEHRDARATGCPVGTLAMDLPRMSPKCRAAFAAGTRGMVELIASLLERAGRAGAADAARSLTAELVGAIALARLEPDRAASDRILESSRAAIASRFQLA